MLVHLCECPSTHLTIDCCHLLVVFSHSFPSFLKTFDSLEQEKHVYLNRISAIVNISVPCCCAKRSAETISNKNSKGTDV